MSILTDQKNLQWYVSLLIDPVSEPLVEFHHLSVSVESPIAILLLIVQLIVSISQSFEFGSTPLGKLFQHSVLLGACGHILKLIGLAPFEKQVDCLGEVLEIA